MLRTRVWMCGVILTIVGFVADSSHARDVPTANARPTGYVAEKDDPLLPYFKGSRFYLIIAVNKASVPSVNLPFAAVDATKVAAELVALGYKPVPPGSLTGASAKQSDVETVLASLASFPADTEVIVYYSGHSVMNKAGSDLWLQLYGQDRYGPGVGITVSDLISRIRENFDGRLSIILDSCFSGMAGGSQKITLGDLAPSTVLFTSSDRAEESRPIVLDDGTKLSAFTYAILDGIQNHWEDVDSDKDGFITYDELMIYVSNRLGKLAKDGKLPVAMHPQELSNGPRIFAYDRAHVQHWDSPMRDFLLRQLVATKLSEANLSLDAFGATPLALRISWAPDTLAVVRAAASTRYGRATAEILDGHFEEGLRQLAQIQVGNSEEAAQVGVLRALALAGEGKYRDAMYIYQDLGGRIVSGVPARYLLRNAGTMAALGHEYTRAELLFKKSTANFSSPLFRGDTTRDLAALHVAKGDRKAATQLYQEALLDLQHSSPPGETALTEADLGELYRERGDMQAAAAHLKNSIAARQRAGVSDKRLMIDLDRYASILATKRDPLVTNVEEQTQQLREGTATAWPADVVSTGVPNTVIPPTTSTNR